MWRVMGVSRYKDGWSVADVKKWIGVKEENIKTIIGEDFNMRTGRK